MKSIMIYENTKRIMKLIELRLETLEKSDITAKKEQQELQKLYQFYQEKILEMEKELKLLKGVEYSLYYEMAVNGLNANKAVNKVALEYDLSDSAIWKNYYPKVKELLEHIK